MLMLTVACAAQVDSQPTATTEPMPTTTTPLLTTTATTLPTHSAGHMIKLDPLTLEPVSGLDPFLLSNNSWSLFSADRSLVVSFEWNAAARIDTARTIDVHAWEQVGAFELSGHSGRAFDDTSMYSYDATSGLLLATDMRSGQETVLDEWPPGLWFWDDLHVLSEGRIAALGALQVEEGESELSLFIYVPTSRVSNQFSFGPLYRIYEESGFYDGETEIAEQDSPGVAWGPGGVFVVYADGPEVVEIDYGSGRIETHMIETSTWLDRLWAFWAPAASAKGPALGTYTSAALSPDGRLLYISGNKQVLSTGDDGNLVETSEHLGLMVVDTETWRLTDSPDLPIQFVLGTSGGILGVDTTSLQPWVDNYYVLAGDPSGAVAQQGPFTLSGGGCDLTPDLGHLLCNEYGSEAIHVHLIDIETGDTIKRRIGLEDVLHSNGILEDWLPRADP